MKHYPHDLSDVVIHPLYKTQLFEFILRLLFVLLYPAASFSLCKKYSTAISNILAGNLDTYQSYLHCCASLVVSRSFSSTTPLLFTALKMRNKEPLGYAASNALAEAMFNMLEDGSHKNFKYWYSWFEERNASFEQWIFLRFVMMILIDD